MRTRHARKIQVVVFLVLFLSASIWPSDRRAVAGDTLPIQSEFSGTIFKHVNGKKYQAPGERSRTAVGAATIAGRAAQLFEIQADHRGQAERFYEWVDAETGIVLKLVSRDRDWSFEYERIRLSPQPSYYFDEPPGYRKRMSATGPRHEG